MASVNDYGGADPDRLDSPPLGGPDGWAAAIAAVVNNDDKTVNARIAEHETAADPHPGYLKPSEIVAGANITVTENAGVVTIAGQAGGGGGDLTVAYAAPTEAPARDGLLWVVVPAPVPPTGPVEVLWAGGTALTQAGLTIAADVPAGQPVGSTLIVAVPYQTGNTPVVSSPGLTFTALYHDSQTRGSRFWAAVLPDSAAHTITVTLGVSTFAGLGLLVCSNVSPTFTLDGAGGGAGTSFTTVHTYAGATLATTADGSLIVGGFMCESNYPATVNAANGWLSPTSTQGQKNGVVAYKVQSAAGNPGDLTINSQANGAGRLTYIRIRSNQ